MAVTPDSSLFLREAAPMKNWFSPLLFLLARSDGDQLRRQVLFLKAELEMTRKRVEK